MALFISVRYVILFVCLKTIGVQAIYNGPVYGGSMASVVSLYNKRLVDSKYGCGRAGEMTHGCTAVVIASQWVLTAAHCVEDNTQYEVHYGSKNHKNGQIFGVTRKFIHPDFNTAGCSSANNNDIALVKVSSNIPVTQDTKGWIPSKSHPLGSSVSGYTGRALGWGMTSDANKCSVDDLRSYEGTVLNRDECRNKVGSADADCLVRDNFICLASSQYHVLSGDSGGPLMVKYDGKDFVIGVCASYHVQTHTSGYVETSKYADWIYYTMRDN